MSMVGVILLGNRGCEVVLSFCCCIVVGSTHYNPPVPPVLFTGGLATCGVADGRWRKLSAAPPPWNGPRAEPNCLQTETCYFEANDSKSETCHLQTETCYFEARQSLENRNMSSPNSRGIQIYVYTYIHIYIYTYIHILTIGPGLPPFTNSDQIQDDDDYLILAFSIQCITN